MKKITAMIFIMLFAFAGCGEGETPIKTLPLELSVLKTSKAEIVLSAENLGEETIKTDEAVGLYLIENGDKKVIDHRPDYVQTQLKYTVLPGETAEWVIDIEKQFGKISPGEYELVLGGFELGDSYNGNWHKNIIFTVE